MNWKTLLSVLGLCAVLGITIVAHNFHQKDREMRQLYGRVTPVSVFNWKAEVEDFQGDIPVVIYFHATGHVPEQRTIVTDYAWWNAKKVKVVSIDLDRPENILFAARFGVVRHPAIVILHKDKVVRGYAGAVTETAELRRLVDQSQQK